MSQIKDAKPIATKKPAIARSAMACMLLALVFGCGDADTPPVYIGPGPDGSTGSGGASGMGGISGTGGITGSAGATGTGGTASTGGTGGTAGVATKSICTALTPPSWDLCETDVNCALGGYVCVDSGCKDDAGAPIKQCQPSRGVSCVDKPCPSADYACIAVGGGHERCVRVEPGCLPATETYDCPPGFSCEDFACVDRRMPCVSYLDCPKSHVCTTTPVAKYCTRTHRTCRADEDCWAPLAAGSFCVDVDDDGTKECVGGYNDPLEACVNADCPGSAPVCESGSVPSSVSCGDYGLCFDDRDCGAGFACVGLWQDGRKECVQMPPTPLPPNHCDQVTDCPPQQVCAAPRNGGSPSCQAGKEAM